MSPPLKSCVIACDTPAGVALCAVRAPAAADVADLLGLARPLLPDAAVDWQRARCGIWGRECRRDAVPADGDRVELYLPLPEDPRARRRERAARANRGAGRGR